ncbi:MAG: hypothetical protein WA740_03495 [Candidatus Binataceae bacterium]
MAGIAEFDSSGIAKSVEAFTTLESPKKRELKGPAESKYQYTSYGVSLRSDIPLALKQNNHVGDVAIEIRTESASFFMRAIRGASFVENLQDWYRYARLEDRSSYARWEGLGEFLVSSDGRRVHCRKFRGAHSESFQVYLLQRALSFALVKQGLEPLHATAVVVNGQAIAFLGDSGFGKSTLAACFIAGGHELVTDDLLVLQRSAAGLRAYPGPPRIKLFPAMACRFLGDRAAGVPMNPQTKKLVLPLSSAQLCSEPIPLRAIYVLQAPRESRRKQGIRLIVLDPRQAFLELLRNTYNHLHLAPDRLQRHFAQVSSIANTVRFVKLCHSRVAGNLPAVRDAILADAGRAYEEAACGA